MEETRPRWTPPRWFCHARPDRCLRWRGRPLPLCARCTAIYPALAAGAVAGLLANPPALASIAVFFLLTPPLALDGVTQSLGWRKSRNSLRFATGLLYGFGCGFPLFPLLSLLRGPPQSI
ncbi:MAG: DUF2085 domain-containing protein [Halobacteria archaeon]